jgi:hypothetical protein
MSDGSALTPAEARVRDFLKAKLGDRATITALHTENGTTIIDITAPNDFDHVASIMQSAGPEAAVLLGEDSKGIHVNLSTWWPANSTSKQ